MTEQEEVGKVFHNLKHDHVAIAHYIVERCGDFIYDHERERFIAEFLRVANVGPAPVAPDGTAAALKALIKKVRLFQEAQHGYPECHEESGIHGPCRACRRLDKAIETALAALPEARRQDEICICAAIELASGEVFRGHRHDDAIGVAGRAGVGRDAIAHAEQGFITSHNRFVDRLEGSALQRAAGIVSAQTGELPKGMLFSEDLYLRPKEEQK